ncbi:MAG: hypothetical protein COV66_11645 [Nitrospinae bacterium CG11_big_fil_rev_8_21_14_0_20_45_15]|nr:MAG: hypothetical protein COV66_11645 [Nitrospinae bacterium CG11_big_fil_rev_8_21_14_0_20_45_15]
MLKFDGKYAGVLNITYTHTFCISVEPKGSKKNSCKKRVSHILGIEPEVYKYQLKKIVKIMELKNTPRSQELNIRKKNLKESKV